MDDSGSETPAKRGSGKLVKRGILLKYKKRIFKSNWQEAQLSLFSNATLVSEYCNSGNRSWIQMTQQTTIIIFGKQLRDVPKTPSLPPGYRLEQLLAVGLIQSIPGKKSADDRLTITFHWFLPLSIHDLFDWIVAINNSIPDNKQFLTDDELTMSLVMAEAVHHNNMMLLHSNDASGLSSSEARICPGCEMTSSSQQSGTVDMISDENFYNELGADMGIDCGDFDDCSAFTADAFASM